MNDGEQSPMLSNDLVVELVRQAVSSAPHELCGLLFSHERMKVCPNSSDDPTRSFLLDYADYYRACLYYDGEQPWALVHSHPGRSASLSSQDCGLMDALGMAKIPMVMVIVGLDPVEVKVWKKDGERYGLAWEWQVSTVQGVQSR